MEYYRNHRDTRKDAEKTVAPEQVPQLGRPMYAALSITAEVGSILEYSGFVPVPVFHAIVERVCGSSPQALTFGLERDGWITTKAGAVLGYQGILVNDAALKAHGEPKDADTHASSSEQVAENLAAHWNAGTRKFGQDQFLPPRAQTEEPAPETKADEDSDSVILTKRGYFFMRCAERCAAASPNGQFTMRDIARDAKTQDQTDPNAFAWQHSGFQVLVTTGLVTKTGTYRNDPNTSGRRGALYRLTEKKYRSDSTLPDNHDRHSLSCPQPKDGPITVSYSQFLAMKVLEGCPKTSASEFTIKPLRDHYASQNMSESYGHMMMICLRRMGLVRVSTKGRLGGLRRMNLYVLTGREYRIKHESALSAFQTAIPTKGVKAPAEPSSSVEQIEPAKSIVPSCPVEPVQTGEDGHPASGDQWGLDVLSARKAELEGELAQTDRHVDELGEKGRAIAEELIRADARRHVLEAKLKGVKDALDRLPSKDGVLHETFSEEVRGLEEEMTKAAEDAAAINEELSRIHKEREPIMKRRLAARAALHGIDAFIADPGKRLE